MFSILIYSSFNVLYEERKHDTSGLARFYYCLSVFLLVTKMYLIRFMLYSDDRDCLNIIASLIIYMTYKYLPLQVSTVMNIHSNLEIKSILLIC